MNPSTDILGVILAGGAGRRMFAPYGGGDKALIDLAGKPILAHVIERLAPQTQRTILNANGDAARFASFGLNVVADQDSDRSGPLAGLAATMAWAKGETPAPLAVVSVTADTPFLPLDLVQRLATAATAGTPAIAVSNGQRHPTIGCWPISLSAALAEALARGSRRAENFAQAHHAIEVGFPLGDIGGRSVDPFFNINTPDDLAAARRLLAGGK